jgi:iron-sulfur cluster repair protein YtfE (RIC family)
MFGIKWNLNLKPQYPMPTIGGSIMKAEIEAKIVQLQAQRDAIQAQLDNETAKFNKLVNEIPVEFHNMTQEVFDKLKEFFAS